MRNKINIAASYLKDLLEIKASKNFSNDKQTIDSKNDFFKFS